MHWTWETEPRSFGETVGIKFTKPFITLTSPGKTTPPTHRLLHRVGGAMPERHITAEIQIGMAAPLMARILHYSTHVLTRRNADKAIYLLEFSLINATARQDLYACLITYCNQ